jgi:hypothetical protein
VPQKRYADEATVTVERANYHSDGDETVTVASSMRQPVTEIREATRYKDREE